MPPIKALVVTTALFPLLATLVSGETRPSPISAACVTYSAPKLVPIEGRIIFDFAFDKNERSGCNHPGDGSCSLQGTAKLLVAKPDFSKKGPWNTEFTVVPSTSGPAKAARVTFKDHASFFVQAKWLNEKLAHFSVWWGRKVQTDLIVDFEKQTVVYAEEAYFDTGCAK